MSENGIQFMLTGKIYDFTKRLVQVVIPAISSAYFGLASIWDLPAAEEVVGTMAIVATFLGVVLGVSSRTYESSEAAYDGQIVVTEPEFGPKNFLLELHGDPEDIVGKKSIRFKVAPTAEPSATEEDITSS